MIDTCSLAVAGAILGGGFAWIGVRSLPDTAAMSWARNILRATGRASPEHYDDGIVEAFTARSGRWFLRFEPEEHFTTYNGRAEAMSALVDFFDAHPERACPAQQIPSSPSSTPSPPCGRPSGSCSDPPR